MSTIHTALDRGDFIASAVAPLDKAVKISYRSIDFVLTITGVVQDAISQSFEMISNDLKNASTLIEGSRLFGTMALLTSKDEQGRSFFERHSWQRCADRVFLAGHQALKLVTAAVKWQLMQLGTLANYAVGSLPVFKLVTESLIIVSSFFSAWDNINALSGLKGLYQETHEKFEKWATRKISIALVRTGNDEEIAALKNRYLADADAAKVELEKLSALPEKTEEIASQIAKKQHVYDRCQNRLSKIESKDYLGLADDLDKPKLIDYKIRKWEVVKENIVSDIKGSWLRIAAAVGKIAVISLALTLIAVNYWTMASKLFLFGFGIIVDSTALSKIFYERFHNHLPLPVYG